MSTAAENRRSDAVSPGLLPDGHSPRALPGPAHCPSCERFIGPAAECPYCGADSARNPALRYLRWAAVALATLGLAFLCLMAARREVPSVRIGEIRPRMNFATVRIQGVVERDPYVSREGNYVSFSVRDDSGALRVAAYDEVAPALLQTDCLPRKGVRVRVLGNLSAGADGRTRMFLRDAAHVEILQPDPAGQGTAPPPPATADPAPEAVR
jgi:hypothetical protein